MIKLASTSIADYTKTSFLAILSTIINGCALLVPAFYFKEVGVFNEELITVQDNEMWMRIALFGGEFVNIPEVLLAYRVHLNQTSKKIPQKHQVEKDIYYTWALKELGNKINFNLNKIGIEFNQIEWILLSKKCYNSHKYLVSHYTKNGLREKIAAKLKRIFKTYLFEKIYRKVRFLLSNYIFKSKVK